MIVIRLLRCLGPLEVVDGTGALGTQEMIKCSTKEMVNPIELSYMTSLWSRTCCSGSRRALVLNRGRGQL